MHEVFHLSYKIDIPVDGFCIRHSATMDEIQVMIKSIHLIMISLVSGFFLYKLDKYSRFCHGERQ